MIKIVTIIVSNIRQKATNGFVAAVTQLAMSFVGDGQTVEKLDSRDILETYRD